MIDFKTDILHLVSQDFDAMDQLIQTGIHSQVPLVMQVSQHVVGAGGKRVRPLMCLLSAYACGATPEQMPKIIALSTAIEMLHTATLVHDDVVDESMLRRGVPTANAMWSNSTAVLVGDFLIARAFEVLVSLEHIGLLKIVSSGTCDIAEGEVLQLQSQHDPDLTEQMYLAIIHGKTSRLFELATESAAILIAPEFQAALRMYSCHFGNAFQIVDDILDYTSTAETLGKNVGDDLMEGKATLPLIATLARVSGDDAQLIRDSILNGSTEHLAQVVRLIQQSGGLEYCRQRVTEETELAVNALDVLPESVYKTALQNLAKLAEQRLM